jgi:hypothetical protein
MKETNTKDWTMHASIYMKFTVYTNPQKQQQFPRARGRGK